MKIVFWISLSLILINIELYSQDSRRIFLNENFEATDSLNAFFIRDASIKNGHFYITDMNIKGQVINYGEYKSVNPWIEDGLAKHYIKPDTLYSTGYYKDGAMVGIWLYYKTNQLIDSVNYDNINTNSVSEECKSLYKKIKVKRKDSGEVQTIIDSLSAYFNKHFHLPARTRSKMLSFNANIRFIIENESLINCVTTEGINDTDLIIEIHRVMSEFTYVKKTINPIIVNFELVFKEKNNSNENSETNMMAEVITDADQMPTFKGQNFNKFRSYISDNLAYPEEAAKFGIQGIVFVHFIVDQDGKVSNVKVIKGVNYLLDNEAIRVVTSSPKWEPAMKNGKPVDTSFTFPIYFILREVYQN
jgi:TonB family protein